MPSDPSRRQYGLPAWLRADDFVMGCWVNRIPPRMFVAAILCHRHDKWNRAARNA